MNVAIVPAAVWATGLGLIWLSAAVWIFDRQRRDDLPISTPTADERAAAAKELWSVYPDFPDDGYRPLPARGITP